MVEGTLYAERVAEAARGEVLQLHCMADGHREAMQVTEADNSVRLAHERELRHNLQEDARQALGEDSYPRQCMHRSTTEHQRIDFCLLTGKEARLGSSAAGLICTSERSRRAAARVASEEEAQTLGRQWRNIQRSLGGAGRLWTAAEPTDALHWKLDRHEDPSRRCCITWGQCHLATVVAAEAGMRDRHHFGILSPHVRYVQSRVKAMLQRDLLAHMLVIEICCGRRMRMKRNYKFLRYTEPQKDGGSKAGADPTSPERIALPGVILFYPLRKKPLRCI